MERYAHPKLRYSLIKKIIVRLFRKPKKRIVSKMLSGKFGTVQRFCRSLQAQCKRLYLSTTLKETVQWDGSWEEQLASLLVVLDVHNSVSRVVDSFPPRDLADAVLEWARVFPSEMFPATRTSWSRTYRVTIRRALCALRRKRDRDRERAGGGQWWTPLRFMAFNFLRPTG